MPKVTTTETITPEIKAYSDYIARCADYSVANPSCPLRDNPHYDEALERRLLRAAFGTSQVEYRCPCGLVTPDINDDLRVVHKGTRLPNCNSSTVTVIRTVKKV